MRDRLLKLQQVSQVLVQIRPTAFANIVCDELNGTRHIWQDSRLARLTSLFRKCVDKIDLQLVEVLVYPRQVPVRAVHKFALHDEMELFVGEDVSRYGGSHWREEILLLLLLVGVITRLPFV